MSDWQIDHDENEKNITSSPASNWVVDDSNEPSESLGKSALYALPRVGKDIAMGIGKAVSSLPQMYESSKTEIPGALSIIGNHPLNALQQGLAGFLQYGHNAMNIPHDLAGYAANRLNLIPQSAQQYIPYQKDITSQITQMAGEGNQPGEQLLRGIGRNPLAAISAPSVLKTLNPLKVTAAFNRIKPEQAAKALQDTHNSMLNEASGLYDQVKSEAKNRNINNVNIDPNLIEQARTPGYFPNTAASRKLINQAATGDYEALHNLQSDMGKRSRDKMSSDFAADRDVGEEMHELRNSINENTANHFRQTGNEDLADALQLGRNKYAQFKDLFYGNNTNNAIKNLVDPSFNKVPNNLMNVLSENSVPMQKILDANPFVKNQVKKYQAKQKSINFIKNSLITGAIAGTGFGGGNYIFNKIGE